MVYSSGRNENLQKLWKKEKEDEIHKTFSCNKCDNIWKKVFNDINKVDNIKLQIGNKVEKLKPFFGEGSLKALNIFGQFLMRAFESTISFIIFWDLLMF